VKVLTSQKALAYLSRDPVAHMDMIVPIKRGSAQIIYAGDDGVCIFENKSSAYILTVESLELGKSVISEFTNRGFMVSFHQEFMLELFEEKYYGTKLENYQAVYLQKEKLPIAGNIKIMPIGEQHMGHVITNYDFAVGADYISERIKSGKIFGGFEKGEMFGFVGIHQEGSIGMLKVLKEHRGKGYGAGLIAYATNHQLERKTTPFVQIGTDNEISLAAAKKAGYAVSSSKVYWLF